MSHEVNSCFKIVGYPELWDEQPCPRIDSRGSTGRGRGMPPQANSTQVIGANSASLPSTTTLSDNDRQGLSGIIDEQWNIIQWMMNEGTKTEYLSGNTFAITWILDTSATHHMTSRIDYIINIHPIFPISVKLSTWYDALSSKHGTIKLNEQLFLNNVYLVDGFDTNLISLGQLVTYNFLVGQITDKILILQDRIT